MGNQINIEYAIFKDGQCFKIKNAYFSLYMQVKGAKEKDEANVQQCGTISD